MSEIRSIITGATSRSLVLVDEICRGTETAKGTCIAGSIIETLDTIGCLGIVSTHLHDIFTLPLATKNTVNKAMGTEYIDGHTKPTWKLKDGICKESLAFETAQREGVPDKIIQRAEELYLSAYSKDSVSRNKDTKDLNKVYGQLGSIQKKVITPTFESMDRMEIFRKEVEGAVTIICQKKLIELHKKKNISELATVNCVLIAAREQPPPSTIGASSVYVILRPDKKLYVGEVFIFLSIYELFMLFTRKFLYVVYILIQLYFRMLHYDIGFTDAHLIEQMLCYKSVHFVSSFHNLVWYKLLKMLGTLSKQKISTQNDVSVTRLVNN